MENSEVSSRTGTPSHQAKHSRQRRLQLSGNDEITTTDFTGNIKSNAEAFLYI